MPKTGPAAQLKHLVAKLHAERAAHVSAIAQIDLAFAQLGLAPRATAGRRGRPPGSKMKASQTDGASGAPATRRRRKRRAFKETAEQFVLGFVQSHANASTAEVNKAWKDAGRGGSADNTLTKLTQAKQLKRAKVKEGRGSTYTAI